MRNDCASLFFLLAASLAANPVIAANGDSKAELFAKRADYSGAMISPSGDYVSVITPFEDRHALSLIKLSGNYDISAIKFKSPETVSGAYWTDDQRVVVTKAKDWGYIGSLASTGDVYGADADAGNQQQLFGYVPDASNVRSRFKDRGSVGLLKLLPDSNGEALFWFSPFTEGNSDAITSIYRVNTHTGKRMQIESIPDNVSVTADNNGIPRITAAEDENGEPIYRYRRLATDKGWSPLPAGLTGKTVSTWFFDQDNKHVFMEISDKGEPASLYRADIEAGTKEKLASNPTMEVANVVRAGNNGAPFAVLYDAGRPKVDYLDPKSEWAQLHAGLMKIFPGQLVQFASFSKDSNKLLFFVYSDRHPGAYYIFDRTTKTPQLLFETEEWIDPAKMSATTPIEFKNAGGETLYGFFTAPIGKTGPFPLVVLPHGGPFGISDDWSYDPEVQFLASLGYAVLKVNFRGSGGRGENFARATWRQWGTGIQDDIADGVRYAIAQNLVDPKRICIYGASFGGYSALMNPIRNPGMYKCAIGYAGVYDLAEMYKSGDTNNSRQGRNYISRAIGADPAMLAEQSPSRHADKLDIPVLLIHGKADWRAPYEQYLAMESAMKKANKPFESLVRSNEGHGFYKIENDIEVYKRIEQFLLKNNPPN